MNNIERDGANAVNTLDRQAAITGGSFSVKIGKTRFVVCVLTTENNGFLCGKRAAPQQQQADGGECRQIRNRPLRAHILRVLW